MRKVDNYCQETKTKPKKKYSPATLTAYGSITEMTRTDTFLGNEGQGSCQGSATQGDEGDCS